MKLNITSTLTLNNGVAIPRFGLGTWQAAIGEAREAVRIALQNGYRHIDTAAAYGNETDVAAGIKDSGVPRKDIFVVTKLWNENQGYDSALKAFDESVERLGGDPIDLYLIHWPVKEKRSASWKALTRIYEEKRVRSIGVSNYTIQHLTELLGETPIVPAANQIELSPFLQRRELVAFCRSKGIAIEAYSPLARGRKLADPRLTTVAEKYGKTSAQVAIRWSLQMDYIVIPKSVTESRIIENADVFDFELSQEDMAALDLLEEGFWTISQSFNPETSPHWN